MNKAEFLRKLQIELSKLPKSEVEEAVRYYTEYIEEAGPENEEKAVSELGSPAKIAAQIKADYAMKQLDASSSGDFNGRQQKKSGIPVVLWIIMGIFAAPVALPLAIAGGILAITLVVTCGAIGLALLICVVAVFMAGIICIVAGFATLFADFAGAMFAIGVGLAVTGAMLLAGAGVIIATRAIIRIIARNAHERRQRKAAENGGKQI